MEKQYAPQEKEVANIYVALLMSALAPAVAVAPFGPALITSIIAFIISLAHAVVLGLPIYFVLKKHRKISWWNCTVCGFFVGLMPFLTLYSLFSAFESKDHITFDSIRMILSVGGLGAIGGFAGWLVLPKKNAV